MERMDDGDRREAERALNMFFAIVHMCIYCAFLILIRVLHVGIGSGCMSGSESDRVLNVLSGRTLLFDGRGIIF